MHNHLLVKSFVPAAAIAGYRVVKHDAADNTVIQASADSDHCLGISTFVGAEPANGDATVDVVMEGIAEVEHGGIVTRDDPLTYDAQGRVITATTEGQHLIGYAMASGVLGDIQGIHIDRGSMAVLGQA